MKGYTQGPLNHAHLDGKDEVFFYYPRGHGADFPEPMVFAIARMHKSLTKIIERCVADNVKPNPSRIVMFKQPLEAEFVQRLINDGAAERPLIENAKRKLVQDEAEGTINFCLYALKTEPGEDMGGPLIDGTHRYCAAYELGREWVWTIAMYRPYWERFLVGGVPFEMVEQMLGNGPNDTSRYDGERALGLRETTGEILHG